MGGHLTYSPMCGVQYCTLFGYSLQITSPGDPASCTIPSQIVQVAESGTDSTQREAPGGLAVASRFLLVRGSVAEQQNARRPFLTPAIVRAPQEREELAAFEGGQLERP